VDHLDEVYGGDRPLTPKSGTDRRALLKIAAIMMGACDKALQAAYHRNHTPVEKRPQPWVDACTAPVVSALAALDTTLDPAGSSHPGRHHGRCRRAARALWSEHRHRRAIPAVEGVDAQAWRRIRLSLDRTLTASYRPGRKSNPEECRP